MREAYNRDEIKAAKISSTKISSFDTATRTAAQQLSLDAPCGSGIRKWQQPIDKMPIRVTKTVIPRETSINLHVHPENEPNNLGGGLRIVTKETLVYEERIYDAGDWFFVPNGVHYEFEASDDAS